MQNVAFDQKVAADNGAKKSFQGRAGAAPFELLPVSGLTTDMFFVTLGQVADEFPQWSIYPQFRDRWLRWFVRNSDGALGSAVNTMGSKLSTLTFKINAPGPRSKKKFSDLLGYSNFGKGFASLLRQTADDMYMQDNGWFIELIGAGKPDRPLTGPVLQLAHLDSALCLRTFDPEFPVLYTNPYTGMYHKIHTTRIISGSSFTQSEELARGVGFCAVSRALRMAQIARDIAIYKHEKLSGKFQRAIGFGNGFTTGQVNTAIAQAEAADESVGLTRFTRIPFILSGMDSATLNLLNLASLPDGYDSQTEMLQWIYMLAFAFGTDAREFWPATQSGATKADASIQNMKSSSKGFAEDVKTIEHAINWGVFPDGVELEFDQQDDEQDKRVADLHAVHVWNVQTNITSGVITPMEGRAILISQGVIDPNVLKDMSTPILADDSAPVDLTNDAQQTAEPLPPNTPQATTPQPGTAQGIQPKPGGVQSGKGTGRTRGGPNINPVKSPMGSKETPASPTIKGKPLPKKQATAVQPYTPAEIERLTKLYTELSKKAVLDA